MNKVAFCNRELHSAFFLNNVHRKCRH
jgi:hypothetical protein